MASKKTVLAAVAAVFGAAGRNYGQVELDLYHLALADIEDGDLADAAIATVRGVDFGLRPPSPALLREAVESAHRLDALMVRPARCEPCDGTGWIEMAGGSVRACVECSRFVKADPERRTRLPRERGPIAVADAASKLRAAREVARGGTEAEVS